MNSSCKKLRRNRLNICGELAFDPFLAGARGMEYSGNRLRDETSSYLRQHESNPVDWYAWGPEALDRILGLSLVIRDGARVF